jgi:hypothetical protein
VNAPRGAAENWEIHVIGTARRLLLAIAVVMPPAVMLAGGPAYAQTMPWPGDPQPLGGGPP